jgi:hypothetical protein
MIYEPRILEQLEQLVCDCTLATRWCTTTAAYWSNWSTGYADTDSVGMRYLAVAVNYNNGCCCNYGRMVVGE